MESARTPSLSRNCRLLVLLLCGSLSIMPAAAFGPRLPLAIRQAIVQTGRARLAHSVRPMSGPWRGRPAQGPPFQRGLSAASGDGEQHQGEQWQNSQHWVPSFAPDPALRPPDLAGTVSLMSTSTLPSRGGGQGTVYPSKPRAAVAITICTRPPAFDKPSATRYLLVQRGKDPGKGKWSLPGGSVELGEDLLEAAAREAQEETAIDRDALRLYHSTICTTDAIYRDEPDTDGSLGKVKFHYVISHVAAWVNAGEITRAKAGDDATALQWVTLDELKRLANSDVLVGPVLDVVFRVEKMVRVGMINLDRDLVVLPPQ